VTSPALILLGLAAGAVIVIQQALNTSLRTSIDSTIWAGAVSYVGGTLSMLVFALLFRAPLPDATAWSRVSAWEWAGGFFGALYIVIAIVLVPRVGTATFFALFVAGMIGVSLTLDHFGAFGIPRQPLDLARLGGAALIVAGVALIRR
jgi:transporter family-2 protein